jgi:hypothetical protein
MGPCVPLRTGATTCADRGLIAVDPVCFAAGSRHWKRTAAGKLTARS